MKRIFFVLFLIALVCAAAIITKANTSTNELTLSQKPLVTTSFYPLYFFTKEIGGDQISVINVTPSGAEPHDYEPTTSDVRNITQSRLVLINGAGLEPWSTKVSQVNMVSVGDSLATKEIAESGEQVKDPHVWLDPVLAGQMVRKITQSLIQIDASNTRQFENNEKNLISKLEQLDLEYQTALKSCSLHKIVTSHAAFGYVAARYGFTQIAISGVSPDEEPSPKKLSEISNLAQANNIHYIFFETLVSPRLAETVAKEIGAQTLVFNPLEGLSEKQQQEGDDYFSIQKQNINNLKIALTCM